MNPSLEYQSVSKTYPGGHHPSVNAVNLQVQPGEILALVGESGSGKTTLLRLAAGLEAPDSGQVCIAGQVVASPEVWTPPESRGVGLVFQDGALFPHLTVAQNVCYGLSALSGEERDSVVEEMLRMVSLDAYSSRYPHELSGGERQRLAVARALAPRPTVILLDEPFSNLDPSLRRSVRDEVRALLSQAGATAILVTHEPEDALAVGDRVAILKSGNLEQEDTPGVIYRQPKNEYCARLFGIVNRVDSRWIRPESMTLLPESEPDAVPVEILEWRDLGRHHEATVLSKADANAPQWKLYAAEPFAAKKAWVRLPV